MEELDSRVAVITGAASGIGRALAQRAAKEGMKVVLADVEEDALFRAESELRAAGADVLAVLTDVSKAEEVEALARKAIERFGKVHLLFNNAGVGGGSLTWETTLADWQWVLGVNLWGVIHGVHAFVPHMLQHGEPAHIVNTASILGLISSPGFASYKVSKFGVVTLTETLYHELKRTNVGVSVLCPGGVKTRIAQSDRNRPADLGDASVPSDAFTMMAQHVKDAVEAGMDPSEVAKITFDAIKAKRFYILTHPDYTPAVGLRAQDILSGRNPTNVNEIG